MVFRRFRGQASGPSPEASLMTRVKMHEEDGWAEVGDVKQQRAGTGATTDEEAFELDEAEEIWDWALEGDSSEGSVHQWVLDDFLVSGDPPVAIASAPEVVETPQKELETTEIEMTPDVSPEPPEEHGYRCRGCNACIFHGSDILSSNYQAMTGPGYLIDATQNTTAATDTQTVVYTTGSYVIREVSCEFCDNKLGVTYKVAPDARNEYKVGKFLLGADRLVLPPGVTHPKVK
ncbi:Protein yippee-like 5 [Durusdinium trenchii]|uniref:Protein yippee-like 5 n=1 Tax=Durusdinium trenchii TaxID=1381693 RepID=A0ABP0QTL3_9DINO